MISLLHSTARLPDGWRPAMEAFLGQAVDPKNVEYILAVDEGLEFSLPAETVAGWGRAVLVQQGVTGPNSGYNAAAKAARGDILMTIADDYFPLPDWDEEIRQAIPDVGEEVVLDVDNSDGSTWLLPFSILTRKYYDRYGYILYPGYHGLCGDNEFTIQARRYGVVRPARHIVFEHRHVDRGLPPMDEIYARQKGHYKEAQELFRRRQAKAFPKWPD
ncbi:MAG: glycosyltransferase [Acidobacteria bacterium]|nr:glycosyltransferase [Acidobacteriota bacterium]